MPLLSTFSLQKTQILSTFLPRISAKIYYLDITDEGSNYNSIFTLFNGLRGAEAPVQYRVRNGLDSEQSAQTGIYSMSYYIGEQLIKK